MVATEKNHIIITIATKQLHFVSKIKRKKNQDFHDLLSPVKCEQGGW